MIELMKQWLEAIVHANELDGMYSWKKEEESLRQAIAEAEQDEPAIDTTPSQPAIDTTPSQPAIDTTPQPKADQNEPVAWFWFNEHDGGEWIHIADNQIDANKFGDVKIVPLYTHPQPNQPHPQPKAEKQEPVAWMTIDANGEEDDIWYDNPEGKLLEGWSCKPLYTHSQPKAKQGEPVAMTKELKTLLESVLGDCYLGKEEEDALAHTVIKQYTTPQPRKPLTDEQIDAYLESEWTGYSSYHDCFKEIVRWTEAKHGIKE